MKIAMVVYSHYSRDARVRKYTDVLWGKKHQIDVICLNEKYLPRQKNIRLIKYPFSRKRINLSWYIVEYIFFFIYSFLTVSFLFPIRKYKLIHIHNMPDFLVFAAVLPKLFGAKVILDMHDPMPELFMSKYDISKEHPLVKILFFLENISLRYADYILTANEEFKNIFLLRHNMAQNKIRVIMNCPDPAIFKASKRNSSPEYKLLYMGTVDRRFGLDIAVEAVPKLLKKIPNLKFLIIPKIKDEGKYLSLLKIKIALLKVERAVRILNPMSLEEVAKIAKSIDIGITLAKNGLFSQMILPVKLLEFIALKKPVIATKTKALAHYFKANMIYFLKENTSEEFSQAVLKLYKNENLKKSLVNNSQKFLRKYNWPEEKKKYLKIVNKFSDFN